MQYTRILFQLCFYIFVNNQYDYTRAVGQNEYKLKFSVIIYYG